MSRGDIAMTSFLTKWRLGHSSSRSTSFTEGQWEKVLGSDPSNSKHGPEYPVENVSCADAKAFCKKLGLKLPTEAEWEYACRGPETRRGGPFGGTGKSDDMGWHYSN